MQCKDQERCVVLPASSPQTELRRVNTHTPRAKLQVNNLTTACIPRGKKGGDFRGEGRGSRERCGARIQRKF